MVLSPITNAHSGRTDSNGGHKDNKNKSGLGSYHYHCGEHPPHLHKDGKCPYNTKKDTSTASSKSNTSTKNTSETKTKPDTTAQIKAVQEKLNNLGYDCGTPDGIIGKKTKASIKNFRKIINLKWMKF